MYEGQGVVILLVIVSLVGGRHLKLPSEEIVKNDMRIEGKVQATKTGNEATSTNNEGTRRSPYKAIIRDRERSSGLSSETPQHKNQNSAMRNS